MSITNIIVQGPSGESIYTDTALGTTIDAVKASSATLYNILIDNTLNTNPSYVKLFNLASGSVTLGTTAPDEVIYIPASTKITQVYFSAATPGKIFATALSMACVTTGGTAGVTAPSSNVAVSVTYS
jgi:hypothetical protein